MIYPHYKRNGRNVPILSKDDINNIAEDYVWDFMPQIFSNPQPFDIEGFIESYLGLQLDFQYLSNDYRYLGMTIFNDTDKVIVYLPKLMRADYIYARHGTIIVDNRLLEENQEHRYRFTLGHECGHWVFHKEYFGYNSDQLSLFEMKTPYIQCREINSDYSLVSRSSWDERRWMEWHADKFSASILMPKKAVKFLIAKELNQYIDGYNAIKTVSNVFDVSEQAAYIRLCDLGYINSVDEISFNQLSFL